MNSKKSHSPNTNRIIILSGIVCAALLGMLFGWRLLPRIVKEVKPIFGFEPTPVGPVCLQSDMDDRTEELDGSNPQYSDIQQKPETIFQNLTDVNQFMDRAPVYEDIAPDPNDDQQFLLATIGKIFPEGLENYSREEQSIEILRFVSAFLKLEGNSGCATKILQEGYAICGGKVITYSALSRKLGIPTRVVNMFGLEEIGAHSVVEVFYDDAWHYMDPTYGVFFYSRPEYSSDGKILSTKDLFDRVINPPNMFRVVDEPNIGVYDDLLRDLGVHPVNNNYLAELFENPFKESYIKFFDSAFPVQFEKREQILSFPVEFSLTNSDVEKIGEVDGSNEDLIDLTAQSFSNSDVGFYRIRPAQFHTIFLDSNQPGYIRITYYNPDIEPPELKFFPLKAVHLVCLSVSDYKIEFIFRLIENSEGAFIIFSDRENFLVDAIKAEWLGEEIDLATIKN